MYLLRAGIIRPWSYEELNSLGDQFFGDFLYTWNLVGEIQNGSAPGTTADEVGIEQSLGDLSRTM